MRVAELVTALCLGLFSIYLMWKSAELPIGWESGEGPGAGAFPFWLATGMLLCCIAIVVRWALRLSPPAQSAETYMDTYALKLFLIGAGSLGLMIAAIHIIGVYFSLPLFLLFYIRFLGPHGWLTTLPIVLLTPVITFLFFEIALRITLPKGYTEPLFYPLYRFFF